jgi:hypothetical protein
LCAHSIIKTRRGGGPKDVSHAELCETEKDTVVMGTGMEDGTASAV